MPPSTAFSGTSSPDGFGKDIVDNRSLESLAGRSHSSGTAAIADMPHRVRPANGEVLLPLAEFRSATIAVRCIVYSLPYRPNRYRSSSAETNSGSRAGAKPSSSGQSRKAALLSQIRSSPYCHSGPKFTSQKQVDVGSGKLTDRSPIVDVPQLSNVAYSAPYLHDGSARSLEEIWTVFNPKDTHGVSNDLTKDELNDLIEYLKTL